MTCMKQFLIWSGLGLFQNNQLIKIFTMELLVFMLLVTCYYLLTILFYTRINQTCYRDLQATIYLTSLLNSGLYGMLEICSITMPRNVTQLRSYISVCEDLLPIHNLCRDYCKTAADPTTLQKNIRLGLNDELYSQISSTKNRKRPCPFTVNQ
jgi:hypothetical protein